MGESSLRFRGGRRFRMLTGCAVLLCGMLPAGAALLSFPASATAPAQTPCVVDGVVFSGNARVSTDALTSVTKLRPGSTASQEAIVADQKAILDLYKSKGVEVSITMTPGSPGPGHFVVTWNITEK